MRSFYFAGSLSPLQGHCTPLQLCDLLDEGDRAVEECLEWGSSSNLKLPRAHWQKQRRARKKRTKELDFLSPAVFDGHKASPFWLPSFFTGAFLRKYLVQLFTIALTTTASLSFIFNCAPISYLDAADRRRSRNSRSTWGSWSLHKLAVGTTTIAALDAADKWKCEDQKAADRRMHKWQALASHGIPTQLRGFLPTLSQSCQLCLWGIMS